MVPLLTKRFNIEHRNVDCGQFIKESRCQSFVLCQISDITHWTNWEKKDLLTPSNQVVVFHSHAVSAEHTDDHDIKMEPFDAHPSESRWEQIVQAYCYNTAKDLEE